MTAERAVSMQPVDEVVVLLGRGVPVALIRQWCRLVLVPYLVMRCGSVPKVGTVPPLDLLTFCAKYKFNINMSISLSG